MPIISIDLSTGAVTRIVAAAAAAGYASGRDYVTALVRTAVTAFEIGNAAAAAVNAAEAATKVDFST